MSLLQFQKALVSLVRFPERSFDQLLSTLESGSLTDRERHSLLAASKDPLVRKFADKMRFLRQREAVSVMRLSAEHIPKDVLDQLYFDCFEPTRSSSDPLWLGVGFLRFVLNEPNCEILLRRCPPYVVDLMRYDHAKAYVSRHVPLENDPGLPSGSKLRYSTFSVVSLHHDVPAYDKTKWETGSSPLPVAREMKILFIPSLSSPFYRTFQIDAEVEAFLVAHRENPQSWTSPLPIPFEGMVKVGLCRF